jgi:hypothetical protein
LMLFLVVLALALWLVNRRNAAKTVPAH